MEGIGSMKYLGYSWVVSAVAIGACASNTGSLSVALEAEESIVEGVAAGTETENIADGWTATFSKYTVVIGRPALRSVASAAVSFSDANVFAVDLTSLTNIEVLWAIDDLDSGDYDFSFQTPQGDAETVQHASVNDVDFAQLTAGATYLIAGELSNPTGQSCPPVDKAMPGAKVSNGNTIEGDPCYDASSIKFSLVVDAATHFGPCEIDEQPGLTIPAGGVHTAKITIHGDHLFFNGFPPESETSVSRLAQWWADADLNLDGEVTEAELSALTTSDLHAMRNYDLGGTPITFVGADDNLLTYVRAQLKTQGHFEGEGECAIDQ